MSARRSPRLTSRTAAALVVILTTAGTATAWPGPKAATNRLAGETSPYLLMHAGNPVDWYPWGPEAFARAKAENKPVFLSVGYSSCYWCHVMERESFQNPAIAAILNAKFVCIKVDREERPDVDQVYMAALQVFGRGGWPMSIFLTPDGRPFFGGTYFPPAARDGMEGFPSLLNRVADAWRDQREAIDHDADRLATVVRRTLAGASAGRPAPLSRTIAAAGQDALTEQFDPEYGGFGFNPENARRPKFPEPANLVFLLDRHRRNPERTGKDQAQPSALGMVVTTLDRMARGGIRDQIGGGYHRYATSRYWIVPHFEKMLYDNALLASAHLQAFELTADPRWRAEAEATFAFVARTLTDPDGGFYSSLDAETGGEEGRYYVWTRDEVKRALGEGHDQDAFLQVYGLKRDPNFEDGRYVLLEPRTRAEQAPTLNLTPEGLEGRLAPLRGRLLAVRERRPAPNRDDKVLTSWNGLMIAAHADGYRVLKDPRYREAAEKAADFLLAKLRTADGRLLRTYRNGRSKLPAYLEDYAFLAHGLLRLHAATGEANRLAQARSLTDRMIEDFSDDKEGGFFYTADDHESLIARTKDATDGALPSGNSVAVRNLIALAAATHDARYLDTAGKALSAFSARLAQSPANSPLMLVALEDYLDARPEVAADARPLGPVGRGSPDVVSVDLDKAATSNGTDWQVTILLTIKEGWHVYANPSGTENLLPTRVVSSDESVLKIVKVDYPAGVEKVLSTSGQGKVRVYEGKVSIQVQGRFLGDLKSPRALTVRFQACNDRACLAPASVSVRVANLAETGQ